MAACDYAGERYSGCMELSVHLTHVTGEAYASAEQVIGVIASSLNGLAVPVKAGIEGLEMCLALSHPLSMHNAGKARAQYHSRNKTIYASASIDYDKWIEEDWGARVSAAGDALLAAVGAVAKARLTSEERAMVADIVRDALQHAGARAPAKLIALGPVYLNYHAEGEPPSTTFHDATMPAMPVRMVELKPCDLPAYLKALPKKSTLASTMFKLYNRLDGRWQYHEAWIEDGKIIEHWGPCGDIGQTRNHIITAGADPFALLKSLSNALRDMGFKPLPPSRHTGIMVERRLEGFGSIDDLERRHKLEEFLDHTLGWLGLGHCDGGSIGSGSMEAFCLVVDGATALEALQRELAHSKFSDFSARIAPRIS